MPALLVNRKVPLPSHSAAAAAICGVGQGSGSGLGSRARVYFHPEAEICEQSPVEQLQQQHQQRQQRSSGPINMASMTALVCAWFWLWWWHMRNTGMRMQEPRQGKRRPVPGATAF